MTFSGISISNNDVQFLNTESFNAVVECGSLKVFNEVQPQKQNESKTVIGDKRLIFIDSLYPLRKFLRIDFIDSFENIFTNFQFG